MIFNENVNSMSSSNVKASPYPLGYAGALMHVYENELNYNTLMKSVGISELKYYNETGKDLFVHEAGAFSSFIAKVKEFFKKVIEKIKAIFHTFMAKINSFLLDDKTFVKKYEKEILRKDISDMEFTGYEKFKDGWNKPKLNFDINEIKDTKDLINDTITDKSLLDKAKPMSSDKVDDLIESQRAEMLNQSGSMTESEFREELHDMIYGDKDTFDVTTNMIRSALNTISDSSKVVRDIEKEQKNIEKEVNNLIKILEKTDKNYATKGPDGKYPEDMANVTGNINNDIRIWKAYSADAVIAFGMLSAGAKDANRQAKALCVKVISYKRKNESAMYSESYTDSNDLFDGVDFA